MAPSGSPLEDEPRGLPVPPGIDPGLAMREPFLLRILAEFEAGRLEAYDYTRRVLAINGATSIQQMQDITDQPPDGTAGDADPSLPRGLDAVDLARLRSIRTSESQSPTTRYVALAVVFVMFAVLIGLGMWLATHVHGAALAPSATGGSGLALVTLPWR